MPGKPQGAILHQGGRLVMFEGVGLYPTHCAACLAAVLFLSTPAGRSLIVEYVPGLPKEAIVPHIRPHCCPAVIGGEAVLRALKPTAEERQRRAARRLMRDILAARRQRAKDLDDGRWT